MSETTSVEVVDVEVVKNPEVIMTKQEASELTKSIQSTTTALYVLIKRAHDNKAWVAMGYDSWASYIENEFDFSRARSYQLINQANVIEEINEASGVELYITEREARSIKNRLPEITKKLGKDVKDADLPAEKAEEKTREIIDETKEIDMADKYNDTGKSNNDGYAEEKEDNSAMEEWKPENVDKVLNDDDFFYYNNLMTTLKIFESMPNANEFGKTLGHSNKNTKELLTKAENASTWLNKLISEIK